MDKVKYLSRVNVLKSLDRKTLSKLEAATPMNAAAKGTLIADPHSSRPVMYMVKSGKVRLYRLYDGGKELTVDILGTGDMFGELGAFTTGADNVYAETLEDSVICIWDRARFERWVYQCPEIAIRFIEMMARRLREVEELMQHMAYGSARKRLLFLLWKLCGKFGEPEPGAQGRGSEWIELKVRLTHEELAYMMGSVRETVTSLMRTLTDEGIVGKKEPRAYVKVHGEKLRQALEICEDAKR